VDFLSGAGERSGWQALFLLNWTEASLSRLGLVQVLDFKQNVIIVLNVLTAILRARNDGMR